MTTLELLPIADSFVVSGWKYGTTNYLAPDHTLGFPDGAAGPVPNSSLARLISVCHRAGMRFFLDAVMGFGRQDPYRHVNFTDFHVVWNDGDPEQDGRQRLVMEQPGLRQDDPQRAAPASCWVKAVREPGPTPPPSGCSSQISRRALFCIHKQLTLTCRLLRVLR